MKVLIINGSPRKDGNTTMAIKEMEKIFAESGVEFETMQIGDQDIRGCKACGACKKLGRCIFNDAVNEAAPKFKEADGLVIASPVYMHLQTEPLCPSWTDSSRAPRLIRP